MLVSFSTGPRLAKIQMWFKKQPISLFFLGVCSVFSSNSSSSSNRRLRVKESCLWDVRQNRYILIKSTHNLRPWFVSVMSHEMVSPPVFLRRAPLVRLHQWCSPLGTLTPHYWNRPHPSNHTWIATCPTIAKRCRRTMLLLGPTATSL